MPDVTDYLALGRDELFDTTFSTNMRQEHYLRGIGLVLVDIAKSLNAIGSMMEGRR